MKSIEETVGAKLPESVSEFFASHDGTTTYAYGDQKNSFWDFPTDLLAEQNINGETYPYFQQHIGYKKAHAASPKGTDFCLDVTQGGIPRVVTAERIERLVTIGYENGDLLYLDPEDEWSVWIYWHDGGIEVTRVCDSFDDFLKGSTPRTS